MKIITSLLFLTIAGLHNANAQAISSKKNAQQTTEVAEPANNQVPASTTATLISSGRNPVVQEVPVEKTQETTEPKQELISSERKPK